MNIEEICSLSISQLLEINYQSPKDLNNIFCCHSIPAEKEKGFPIWLQCKYLSGIKSKLLIFLLFKSYFFPSKISKTL